MANRSINSFWTPQNHYYSSTSLRFDLLTYIKSIPSLQYFLNNNPPREILIF